MITTKNILPKLRIVPELENILPPLTNGEREGLERDILAHGCLTPLIAWNDILVEGFSRYEICWKHGIAFSVKGISFNSLEEAEIWRWQHQENRRNLTPFQRWELARRFKKGIAKKARERRRQSHRYKGYLVPGNPIDTRDELCKLAGVSHGTAQKIEYILLHGDEETKEKLRRGDKGTSIHREYMRLRVPEQPKSLRLPFDSDKWNVEKCSAENLSKWLLRIRSAAYVRELMLRILHDYKKRYGDDEADAVYRFLCNSYVQQ